MSSDYPAQQRDLQAYAASHVFFNHKSSPPPAYAPARQPQMPPYATPKMSDAPAYTSQPEFFELAPVQTIAIPPQQPPSDMYTPPATHSVSDLGMLMDSVITPAQTSAPMPDLEQLKLPESLSNAHTRPEASAVPPANTYANPRPLNSLTTSEMTAPARAHPVPSSSALFAPGASAQKKSFVPSTKGVRDILEVTRVEPVRDDVIMERFDAIRRRVIDRAESQKLLLRDKLKRGSTDQKASPAVISSRREAKVSRELKNAYKDLLEVELREMLGITMNLMAVLQRHLPLQISVEESKEEPPVHHPKKRRKRSGNSS